MKLRRLGDSAYIMMALCFTAGLQAFSQKPWVACDQEGKFILDERFENTEMT